MQLLIKGISPDLLTMEQVQEKIFELYLQHLSGSLSAEEERYVQEMLQHDADFKAQWEQLEAESITLHTDKYLEQIDSAAVLQQIREERTAHRPATHLKKWMAAAAVLLLAGSGVYYFFARTAPVTSPAIAMEQQKQPVRLLLSSGEKVELTKDSGAKTIALNNATLSTSNGTLQYTSADTILNTLDVPAGESYKLTLSDGTEVWLNAATRLRFPFHFGRAEREVYVDGEAYFKVAANADKPFVVHTALTSVHVLGTAFNINTYQAGIVKTALVEGSVVTKGKMNERQALQPGIQADYDAGKGFVTSHFDEEEVLSWRSGVYYYHRMPLTTLIATASRFYGIRFVLDKNKEAGQVVTGLMDRNRLEDFLSDLKTTAHIEYRLSGNEITLK
ncbi:FecR family protein [Chitinophaga sp.]|uniref:FecR family protein n=1 Tax=Chitinophaga sp. TaxID=1869181 RepID=UPI002D1D1236|nr:FecR domain-containing protein [Chitinophaga sp.]HWV64882.1 FecR domain-containing protein [Chitinophaga sp.]